MNPESQKVRDIFVTAVKLPPERWATFLKDACAGDEELRRQVSDLLQAHQQAGSFLDQPAVPPRATGEFDPAADGGASAAAQEGPGTTIGPYKLLELIGEGGMATVWMAEQREPVQRKVALKIIKAGMDTRQVVARFEAERQALALMDHPNIAKIFDGGATAGGRPYFVMELVKGVPITKYCDQHRLTPRERLELFLPVCQAIQHAHQKGIIHRDVKPSNVLVAPYDGRPVPKVIDFGVAKATGQRLTERTLFTGFGALVGTLEYMSPEQAELNNQDIDTRSDIYSLGVLLYELLTGTTPLSRQRLTQTAFAEMLRIIREEEPPRPSTRLSESKDELPSISAERQMEPAKLTKLVRGELDWIVMKTLEKDRNRRYETANGLATDVLRYLADEPVQACPPTLGYRLRKLVRRNKGPMLAVGLVLLALVAGIIGTTWGLVRADKARRVAVAAQLAEADRAEGERRAKQAETAQRLLAENNAKLAMATLDNIFIREARQRIALYRQDEAKGLAKNPEREKMEREFLEKGLPFYEKIAQTNATDWAARRERAKAYTRVGLLQLELKSYVESEKAFRHAIQLMEELAGERPDDFNNGYDLADTYRYFCILHMDTGRLQPAEETIRHALVLYEKLVAAFPDRRSQTQKNRVYCQRKLGEVLERAGKLQEAEESYRRALGILEKLVADYPAEASYREEQTYCYRLLAKLLEKTGRKQEAERAYRQTLAINEKMATDFPAVSKYRIDVVTALHELGGFLATAKQTTEAEESYRHALGIVEKLVADYPAEAFYRQEQAWTWWRLANLLKDTGRAQEAEKAYCQAVAVLEKLADEFPGVVEYRLRLSGNLVELGYVLAGTKRTTEAEESYRRAFGIREKLVTDYPAEALYRQDQVWTWWRLDNQLKDIGRIQEAEKAYRRALEIIEKLVTNYPDVAYYRLEQAYGYQRLADLLKDTGRAQEAEKVYRQILAIHEKLVAEFPGVPEYRSRLAGNLVELGYILAAAKRPTEAEEAYRRALEIREKLVIDYPADGLYRQEQAWTWWQLANLLNDTGRVQEAEKIYRQILAIHEKLVAEFPEVAEYRSRLANNLFGLANILATAKKTTEAEECYRRALEIRDKLITDYPAEAHYRQDQAWGWWRLADLLRDTSRAQEGDQVYRQAIAIYKKLAAEFPGVVEHRWGLAGSLEESAKNLLQQGHYAEAEAEFREAVRVWEKMVAETNAPDHRWHLANALEELAKNLLQQEKHAEAAKAAEELSRYLPNEWRPLYRAADLLSRCTALADKDPSLSETDRITIAKSYADRSRELMREAAKRTGDDPGAQNTIAWQMATHPDPRLRDPDQAVELAKKAVQRMPREGSYWNTLGTAQYRAGNWQAAIEDLTKASQLYQGRLFTHDAFFLAMAYWQLGQQDQARKWYAPAVLWMDKYQPDNEELRRFRVEAATLLGLPEQAPPGEVQGQAEDLEIANLILEADPSAAWAYQIRGNAQAELGQWEKAAADYAKAVELKPDQAEYWYRFALVRLGAADTKGYRDICTSILERFGKTEDLDIAYWVVWPCVLAPDAVAQPAVLVTLAEKSVAKNATNFDYLNTLGAALYRAGRFEESARRLGEAATAHKPESNQLLVYNWFFLAMAHHRLGHTEEARKWLEKTIEWMDQAGQEQGKDVAGKVPMPWNRRLTLQLLRGEAETLIQGTAKK
jgi:serine/threonine protein kinase/tetratricopeptide (TPR) repeat protein